MENPVLKDKRILNYTEAPLFPVKDVWVENRDIWDFFTARLKLTWTGSKKGIKRSSASCVETNWTNPHRGNMHKSY